MKIKVNRIAEKKINKGIRLLVEEDFQKLDSLNDRVVSLFSVDDRFLGKAYLSHENKGRGWIYSYSEEELSQEFFVAVFTRARQQRRHFYRSDLTNAFRLFNQDGDHFGGVTIDLYNEYAVFSWYNTFVYSMKDTIIAAFQIVYPEVKGAYEKIRFKGLDFESAFLYGQEAPEYFTVLENGVSYQVFMNDGLMTGIFLDQHEVRGSLVDGLATGKNLLNMFSYTAAFSIAAAMGGAIETTSVDLAKRSRELSKAHFKVNGVELDNHHFVVMDVFEYFKYAKRKGLHFDVVVLDPPSFARNKKQTFSVAKDYHKLISQSLEILHPNGIIIASTNAANVSVEKFRQQIEKGFGSQKHRYLADYRLPADFTINKNDESSNYLKVFTIRVEK
ncbi:TPA: class I SAM-dependent rRNA methyltransferase [Streptococcus suis]